jgi:hypothetical protein
MRSRREQRDVLARGIPIGTTGPPMHPSLHLGEGAPEPLPESLEVFLVFVVEANQKSKDEGEGGLEWAVIGKESGDNDEEIEEDSECCETDENAGDNSVDGGEEIVGEGKTEEEESDLEHQG